MKNLFIEITGKVLDKTYLTGGDINDVYRLICEKGEFVLKQNKKPYKGMFKAEAEGLNRLKENNLPAPEVICSSEEGILLKYYKPGPSSQKEAGRSLALLHQNYHDKFGYHQNNYIGSLNQINTWEESWIQFYSEHRIMTQLNLFQKTNKISVRELKIWNVLLEKMSQILSHKPRASLLHGDLWSGNLYFSEEGPLFIDPAVYYGDCLIELSFTELFGGFSHEFYSAYREINSIDPCYSELKKLYQIYPLLVHANLFGGGYYSSAYQIAKYYAE